MQLHIRTPLLESQSIRSLAHFQAQSADFKVYLKLDNCQPAGSFKLRGIGNRCNEAAKDGAKNIVSSSGGNAGLAAAYSARKLQIPATIFVPSTTPEYMQDRMRLEGAQVKVEGNVWNEANEAALSFLEKNGGAYIPPFDHPDIWEGNSTVIDELKEEMEEAPDLIIVSVGGGGYFCGVCLGLERAGGDWAKTKVLAVETEGANSLDEAIKNGKLVKLPAITSVAKSLGALQVGEKTLEYAQTDRVVNTVVSDKEATTSAVSFARDHKMLVEPACGASLSVVYSEKVWSDVTALLQKQCQKSATEIKSVCVLVCGGNMTEFPFNLDRDTAL